MAVNDQIKIKFKIDDGIQKMKDNSNKLNYEF